MIPEKRTRRRRPLNVAVMIHSLDGALVGGCNLHDLSDAGAKLTIEDADDAIPNEFVLSLAQDETVRRRCRIVWQSGDEIGIQFVPASPDH